MRAVFKRELQAFFYSPIGYVFLSAFMFVMGLYFISDNMNVESPHANFVSVLSSMTMIFIILVPILTMRLLSEERKNKSDQLWMTAPMSITSVVVGKFLAAVAVLAITLVFSTVFPIILSLYGDPSGAEILSGYFGFFLLGSMFISVGVWMSALTENQISSAIATFVVLLMMMLVDIVSTSISNTLVAGIVGWLSAFSRFTDFNMGVLSLSTCIYYVSLTIFFIVMAVRTVEKRRWSEG